MSQHKIDCPYCKKNHEVDVLRSGGKPKAMISLSCKYESTNVKTIESLIN